MKDFLNYFAAILGCFTVALLVMSVSHELGYFYIVGSQFQTFLTTTDYLSNAVVYLPMALVFAYGWIDWTKLRETTEPQTPKDWKNWKTWIAPCLFWFFFVFMITTTTWPPLWSSMYYFVTIFVLVWGRTWKNVFPFTVAEPTDLIYVLRQLVRLGPPLIVGMFVYGYVEASGDVSTYKNPYIFAFKGNEAEHDPRIFLRNFDRGVLIRNPTDNRVEFVKWDDVISISKLGSGLPARPLYCWLFKNLCVLYAEPATP